MFTWDQLVNFGSQFVGHASWAAVALAARSVLAPRHGEGLVYGFATQVAVGFFCEYLRADFAAGGAVAVEGDGHA